MKNNKVLGIDIGGTKVACGLVVNDTIENLHTIKISSKESKDFIIEEVLTAIGKVFVPEVEGIGVGVPGLVDSKNGIVYQLQNIPSWKEVHLKEAIEARFGVPACINNDANCFAIGEKYFGKAKEYEHFIGLAIGTGLGAGIVTNGKLYSGVSCGAGELGSLPYQDQILEYYCSGQFFAKVHGFEGSEIAALAEIGDTRALDAYKEFGQHLGHAIKTILYTLAPEAVILGGSVSQAFEYFKDSLWESVHQFPFKKVIENFKIERSTSGNTAILGAAALCLDAQVAKAPMAL